MSDRAELSADEGEPGSPGSDSRDASADGLSRPLTPAVDLSGIRTISVEKRPNKVNAAEFARPPAGDRKFSSFLKSLPNILEARSFLAVVDAIVDAARDGRPVIVMMGGHVIKTGLAPVLIDLVRRGVITHLASNGSTVIHDYEMARWGGTSEDVAAGLADGSFGMVEETGRGMNEAIRRGAKRGAGMGEALVDALAARDDLAEPELSLLLATGKYDIGFTVHAAVGADIIHQHPAVDGGAIGSTSHEDFLRFAGVMKDLDGGVVLNLGSAVIMPEVFLKALTVCRNLNDGRPRRFTTADFDMIRHYRPRVNVVERPTEAGGGSGYQITGHHEIMVPLLAWAVVDRLES